MKCRHCTQCQTLKLENQNSLLRVSVGTFFLVFRSAFLVEAEKDDEHGDNLDVKKRTLVFTRHR